MHTTARGLAAGAALLALAAAPAAAQDISTHVLDLARGVGGAGVPVTLERQDPRSAAWRLVGRAVTDANGRARGFGDGRPAAGVYRLTFDMRRYAAAHAPSAASGAAPAARPFFPEIAVTFDVPDAVHYHVPVVVSPFGYSTYRGNGASRRRARRLDSAGLYSGCR